MLGFARVHVCVSMCVCVSVCAYLCVCAYVLHSAPSQPLSLSSCLVFPPSAHGLQDPEAGGLPNSCPY